MNTDHHVSEQLTAEQYRARAHLARCTAEEMTRETMRRQLLRIAEEYEVLADRLGTGARIGVVSVSSGQQANGSSVRTIGVNTVSIASITPGHRSRTEFDE
jgi:hypothetical protein